MTNSIEVAPGRASTTNDLIFALRVVRGHLAAAYFAMERERGCISEDQWQDFVKRGGGMYLAINEMLEAAQARADEKAFQAFMSAVVKAPKRARKRKVSATLEREMKTS